jgi:RHS repeat-associated protein
VSGTLTTTFTYDGDGNRVGKSANGQATDYLLDPVVPLPVVISDSAAVYLYGLDIIARQQGGTWSYYQHDGLGSVRQLSDPAGQAVQSYAYDPFGGILASNGAAQNPFQYTGEQWDSEAQLLYLRARYYSPSQGRFISKDPWPGSIWWPGTLNSYQYVLANPVRYVDPSGLTAPNPPPWEIYIPDWPEWAKWTVRVICLPFGCHVDFSESKIRGPSMEEAVMMLVNPCMVVEQPLAKGTQAVAGKITGFTEHGINQIIERGIKPTSILDAIKNPLQIRSIVIDELGRPSQRFIGREAEVVINPETGRVISVNPTSTEKVERLLRQLY